MPRDLYSPVAFLAASAAAGVARRDLVALMGSPIERTDAFGHIDRDSVAGWFAARAGDVTEIADQEPPEEVGKGLHGAFPEIPAFVWEHACRAYLDARRARRATGQR
jgi:hypothetical protein